MRIGIIGLGFMGATHLRAWGSVDGAQLAAVASSDEAKLSGDLSSIAGNLDNTGERFEFGDASRYATAAELIADPTVDAVDLCTPSFLHADQAVAALKAGKHVLVEKPMATTAADCQRMLDAATASGKVLMIGHVLRFWPDYIAALSLIRSGALGPLRSVALRRKCGAPGWSPWLRDKSKSGGAALDLLIHDFDFCRQLVGLPHSIRATGTEISSRGVDLIEARLNYGPKSPQVVVSGGWHHPDSYPFSMEFTLVCEEGTLDFRSGDHNLTLYRANGKSELVPIPEGDAFESELAAFVAACETGKPPAVCNPTESAESTAIARAADLSRSRGGEEVTL
jgi:predicted dehydrogenase